MSRTPNNLLRTHVSSSIWRPKGQPACSQSVRTSWAHDPFRIAVSSRRTPDRQRFPAVMVSKDNGRDKGEVFAHVCRFWESLRQCSTNVTKDVNSLLPFYRSLKLNHLCRRDT